MKKIENAAVIGMGALGMLYGSRLMTTLGRDNVKFLMDSGRLKRHSGDTYTVNGTTVSFTMEDAALAGPQDLVILAVKYPALQEALREMAPAVGRDSILMSVMNGITSEEKMAERFPRRQIIGCVAIGMDAMREGTRLHYTKAGRLQIGELEDGQKDLVRRTAEVLQRSGIACEVTDIRRAMWNKFMLNVGVNQACTAYATDYGHVTADGPLLHEMEEAMREVLRLAKAQGVQLTEEDLSECIRIEKTLCPESYPSMRQDMVAGRKTEVDMFAGTVIRLGKKYGIPTPVNEKYARMIHDMEAQLPD